MAMWNTWLRIRIIRVDIDWVFTCPLDLNQAYRVSPIYRITLDIAVQVCAQPTAAKTDRILYSPPPGLRVVVPRPESHDPGMLIEEPAGEAERLEAGVGVECDVAELVIV